MKRSLFLIMILSSAAFAQENPNTHVMQGQAMTFVSAKAASVEDAPYAATVTNESVQTLADGNRIVQTSTGTTARDAQGRTRMDTALPPIGSLSAANAPHLVFIQDPVAQVSYVLNLTEKSPQKVPMLPPISSASGTVSTAGAPAGTGIGVTTNTFYIQAEGSPSALPPAMPPPMALQRALIESDKDPVTTEDLGSQTMEGITVQGKRVTHIIPSGQIGNEKPLVTVTEVWTSPDLKTVIYSKRSDPRMGEHTFQLTNIVRGEPDPALFAVPTDFKITEGPQRVIYRSNQ
jgi:hypothetical protein